MTIWYISCSFGTFFSGFGLMCQEKSGNPAIEHEKAFVASWETILLGKRIGPMQQSMQINEMLYLSRSSWSSP
jgi:hypothetical protein